jgi:hypothetical protein
MLQVKGIFVEADLIGSAHCRAGTVDGNFMRRYKPHGAPWSVEQLFLKFERAGENSHTGEESTSCG